MPRFGELEAAIMDEVWAADEPVTVRDVLTGLQRERAIAYTTVQTVMENLFHKGWLAKDRAGRAHRYRATATAEDYTAQLMDEALAGASDRSAALARFVERMEADEIAQLTAALQTQREQERQ